MNQSMKESMKISMKGWQIGQEKKMIKTTKETQILMLGEIPTPT